MRFPSPTTNAVIRVVERSCVCVSLRYKDTTCQQDFRNITFVTLKWKYFSKPLHLQNNRTNQIVCFEQPMKWVQPFDHVQKFRVTQTSLLYKQYLCVWPARPSGSVPRDVHFRVYFREPRHATDGRTDGRMQIDAGAMGGVVFLRLAITVTRKKWRHVFRLGGDLKGTWSGVRFSSFLMGTPNVCLWGE